jgi:hypothetical protein
MLEMFKKAANPELRITAEKEMLLAPKVSVMLGL